MDPFTEKLLERTRARRENLQKKMAERPNAANRQQVKRSREPLADTNSLMSAAPTDKGPQTSSKRRCSGENVQLATGEENQEPRLLTSLLPDPPTDKKPPVGPAAARPTSPLELRAAQPETPASCPRPSEVKVAPAGPVLQGNREEPVEEPAAVGMKTRLQRLAEQRRFWDGDESPDSVPLSLLKRQADVLAPSSSGPSMSPGPPLGRRGRLANLAAAIGSWEDDLSHTHVPRHPPPAAAAAQESSQVPPRSPQTAGTQNPPLQTASHPPTLEPPNPLRKEPLSSPQKPDIRAKPTAAVPPQDKSRPAGVKSFMERFGERCQERVRPNPPAGGAPRAIHSLVQEGVRPSPPAGGAPRAIHSLVQEGVRPSPPAGGAPRAIHSLVQERLRASAAANTSTAELTQRQKLEREAELAQVRSRLKKGKNVWTNDAQETDVQGQDEPAAGPPPGLGGPSAAGPPLGLGGPPAAGPSSGPGGPLPTVQSDLCPLPASTSSPLRPVDQPRADEVEVPVDQSITSDVINELFEGILEQGGDEEEEDALNISSMSLLTPLAETVAAVVKSPERTTTMMMTSTPDSSFVVQSSAADINPSRFQRADVTPCSPCSSDEDIKLPYSIDAYRSTRVKEAERPGVKQVIVRKEDVCVRAQEPPDSSIFSLKHKMKVLTSDLNLQQTIIHQASQALSCCTDQEHGKGSQVEAEAERLLLVATERREQLKAELERLQAGGPGGPGGQKNPPVRSEPSVCASKGSVTLQELRLPLKAEFVCSTANRPESTKHSFFILIRAGVENTVATQLASTHRGLSGDTLTFPTRFTISDVCSDFSIDIQVYCLVQRREVCSDKKKKPARSKAITPKRFLAITKGAHTPVVSSPGGPHAVRSSNFVLVGAHKLTLASVGKNKFPLEKVPFLCPLEGHVYLRMQCEGGSQVEGRGFLTMFEDVSGFGAWHRRWCVLSGHCVSYWTYPDDEKRKGPIGRIDLSTCSSRRVEPVSREFCARPHTLELMTVRPRRDDDQETLVSQCHGALCVTRNWLSADTKDERNVWMTKVNQVLVDLRMWHPDACARPL